MKLASKTLYIIGLAFIAFSMVGLIISLVRSYSLAEVIYDYLIKEGIDPSAAGLSVNIIYVSILSSIIIALIAYVVAAIFASIAIHKAFHNDPSKTPHILAIVAGGLTDSVFLIVGGILGIIASRRKVEETKQIEEQVSE